MAKGTIGLVFPLAGQNRRWAYQSQPPFSTPGCLNVRPDATLEGRARGGSRPGLARLYGASPSPGNPIRLVQTARQALGINRKQFIDTFDGSSLGDDWENVVGSSFPSVADGEAYPGDNSEHIAVYKKPDTLDESAASSLSIDSRSAANNASFVNESQYRLYFHLDDANPDPSEDGVTVYMNLDNIFSGSMAQRSFGIEVYSGGVNVETFGPVTFENTKTVTPGRFSVGLNGTTYTIRWNGTVVASFVVSTAITSTQTRVGFGFDSGRASQFRADNFTYGYGTAASIDYKQKFICSANGKLFYENDSGELVEIGSYAGSGATSALASDRRLRATEAGGKLYIADYSEPTIEGSAGTIASNTTLDDAAVSDWTAYASAYDYAAELFNHDNSGSGVYPVTAVASGDVTLGGSPADTSSATGYRLGRCPKYYDLAENALYSWTQEVVDSGAGQLPLGCPVIWNHQGRVSLAGAAPNPNIFYMARQGNPLDFDYSETDAQSAVASDASFPGVIGHPIVAAAATTKDTSIIASRDSLYLLAGNPAAGGLLDALSHKVGVVTPDAWCLTPNGDFVFVSRNGVYVCAGGTTPPQKVSEHQLPNEFKNLGENDDVQLAYDVERHGIHVFVTRTSGVKTHFWLNWDDEPGMRGFFPDQLGDDSVEPSAVATLSIDSKNRTVVVLGCEDGFIRCANDDADDDDGFSFESYVVYGPIRLGGDDYMEGILDELIATLAVASGDVEWILYAGATNEEVSALLSGGGGSSLLTEDENVLITEDGDTLVVESSTNDGSWSAGRNYTDWVKSRGGAFALRVSGTGTAWSVDSLVAKRRPAGKQKVL